ncbi:hypothetical protein [Paludibaculum fermentans]|uniref:hypothetical protein n=1 Tax=Paludibaculum fermentans TaxID=1473598 RepID=UPI003EBB9DBB
MGLDYIELVLALEDAFQISIADEEASGVVTVGDLHALVLAKLKGPDTKRCLTSAAFYRVRRGLVEVLGVDRRSIRPATLLRPMMPLGRRRTLWRRIQDRTTLKLPNLGRHTGVTLALLALGLALTVIPGLRARLEWGWLVCLAILGLIVGGVLMWMSPMLALEFPYRAESVGDLARGALASNYSRLVEETGSTSPSEIWEVFCRIFIEQTGVSREDLRLEARIVDELGID